MVGCHYPITTTERDTDLHDTQNADCEAEPDGTHDDQSDEPKYTGRLQE